MHGNIELRPSVSSRLKNPLLSRCFVILIALAILFWRTPTSFTNPQFWGEDVYFFYDSRALGWVSILKPLAGYMSAAQYLVGVFASYFDAELGPSIFSLAAITLTLLVVWIVTSPRLDMPLKPLLAIAIVVVPMGREELGTTCNIQWVLPIGAFALLFMRHSKSFFVLAGEVLFTAIMAASGPFSIFMAPLFAWQTFTSTQSAARRRLALLTTIVAGIGLVQGVHILTSMSSVPAVPYSPTLWITIPLKQVMTTFSVASRYLDGMSGAIIGAACLALTAALCAAQPYQRQKTFMLLFSLMIAIGGLYKFHNDIASQATAQRYFYVASVFSLWMICCLSTNPRVSPFLAILVVVFEIIALPIIKDRPPMKADTQWAVWSQYISSGVPLIIPTLPPGMFLPFPATSEGRLRRFTEWIGKNIGDVTSVETSACRGDIVTLEVVRNTSIPGESHQGQLLSTTWQTTNEPIEIIALTGSDGTIHGFGQNGFADLSIPRSNSGWKAFFYSEKPIILAYGIVGSGNRACPFHSQDYR
jgi:hypothetical protein